jgi:hypothetical protein
MATASGTATDYLDLLSLFRVFVTGLAGPETWVVQRNTLGGTAGAPTGDLILKAPGLAGTDQIFVGVQPFANVTADYFNWRLGGFTGYDNALAFGAQPGVMQNVFATLWNSPIDYWFSANGRRAYIVAKISTSYILIYLGLYHAYASPAQYPLPMLIGGNLAWETELPFNSVNWRWSLSDNHNHNFPWSNKVTIGAGIQANTHSMRIRSPAGVWLPMAMGLDGVPTDQDAYNIWPYMAGMTNLQQNLGSPAQSPVLPIILHDATPEVYGELDGIAATSGQGIASEDILTVGSDSWLVVQDVFRTDRNRYCAVRLV